MPHIPKKAAELADLRKQNDELRALNAGKDEFIALASHQLRTPATGVKQYLGMLLEGYLGELDEAQKDFIQKAYDNNERQINTINDLLHVAQLDAGKIVLHYEQCNVAALVKTIAAEFQGVIKHRSQALVLKGAQRALYAQADPLRLRMALDNLIDNASKYSEEQTAITVTLAGRDGTVRVTVTDQGVGIAEADYARLFQKFSRIDNPRSIMVGGNGLGLYLAKQIIDAHGGALAVTSVLGEGTTFTLELPQAKV